MEGLASQAIPKVPLHSFPNRSKCVLYHAHHASLRLIDCLIWNENSINILNR